MADQHIWTEDRTALLRELWGGGLSASQIAARIGGLTRNAVIGKATRLGLGSNKAKSALEPKKHRQTPFLAPTPHIMLGDNALFIFETAVENPVRLLDLNRNTCRWPVAGEMFCGAQSVEGRPYCERHCDMAYRRAYERRA